MKTSAGSHNLMDVENSFSQRNQAMAQGRIHLIFSKGMLGNLPRIIFLAIVGCPLQLEKEIEP
jgi:hypothetical protein